MAATLGKAFKASIGVVSVVPRHPGRSPVDPWTTAVSTPKTSSRPATSCGSKAWRPSSRADGRSRPDDRAPGRAGWLRHDAVGTRDLGAVDRLLTAGLPSTSRRMPARRSSSLANLRAARHGAPVNGRKRHRCLAPGGSKSRPSGPTDSGRARCLRLRSGHDHHQRHTDLVRGARSMHPPALAGEARIEGFERGRVGPADASNVHPGPDRCGAGGGHAPTVDAGDGRDQCRSARLVGDSQPPGTRQRVAPAAGLAPERHGAARRFSARRSSSRAESPGCTMAPAVDRPQAPLAASARGLKVPPGRADRLWPRPTPAITVRA